MTLAYRTASGQTVTLKPLELSSHTISGAPALRLGGRDDAAMTTGRVMRAVQSHFEFPMADSTGVVRVGRSTVAADELRSVLAHKKFAAFEDGESGALRLLYRELMVRFRADVKAAQRKELLKRSGLVVRSVNTFNGTQFVVTDRKRRYDSTGLIEAALALSELDAVEFAAPNFVSQYQRSATVAALVPSAAQWHLRLVRARQAWRLTRGKRSITIAILDDGVDVDHPELKANIRRKPDPSEARDLNGRDFFLADTMPDHFDPRPKRFRTPFDRMAGNDIHGTPCAGVAAGRGPRGYGLAPRCRILPVKIFHADDLASDAQVADAIRYAALHADVLSCSWSGPRSPDLEFALQDASRTGRAGLGSIVLCATGNDAAARVGYPASDPNAIGIGASTDGDKLASYSNRGPQVWVVAPSSGGQRGIFCTDVALSGRGFNIGSVAAGGADGLFTNSFGGTSSATPLVAGLVALLLSRKKGLTPAEVKRLLADSAVKIGAASSYNPNGHSLSFGYGRIDAAAALALL